MGDRRHPRQRRARWCSTTARPTTPVPTGSGPSSSVIASSILGVSPTLVRALMAQRRRTGPRPRPVVAARLGFDRRTVERRAVVVVLRRRRRRPLPRDQHLGRHRSRRVLPVAARRAAAVAVLARRARARHGGRRVRRRRPLGARRGRRARVHEAVAGHDTRPVAGPRALPRDVLVALAGRLVARRLRERRRTTASGSCTDVRTTRSRSRASGSVRPRSRPCSWRIPRCWRRPRSAFPTTSRAKSLWVYVVVRPGVDTSDALRDELRARVAEHLGPSFRPSAVRFTDALPKTRSAKVLRRAIRAVVTGTAPGDLSGLEDPAALDAIAAAH